VLLARVGPPQQRDDILHPPGRLRDAALLMKARGLGQRVLRLLGQLSQLSRGRGGRRVGGVLGRRKTRRREQR
jgi:hypothetical protein